MTEWTHKIYNEKISPIITKPFISLGITPNQVTVFNFLFTITIVCFLFSRGTHLGYLLGLCACIVNIILDYVDGDLARRTGLSSKAGEWFDSIGDIILQNSIMAAICFGILKGLTAKVLPFLLAVVMLFFIGNSIMNVISVYYNNRFGFNSYKGNKLFRGYMNEKDNFLNRFLKNLIDPTSSWLALSFYTVRYWIVLGALFNIMPLAIICITIIGTFRWVVMYVIYALYLLDYKKLWVVQALGILDESNPDYYRVRYGE